MTSNGGYATAYTAKPEPILRKLDAIECRDALVKRNEDGTYAEAQWPVAEHIIGNPPFLGSSRFIAKLNPDEVRAISAIYKARVDGAVDLFVYWFEKALAAIASGRSKQVGLVAKNTFEQRSNRAVLMKIAEKATIFSAWTRLPWVNEGAAVQVHLICFGTRSQMVQLNGDPVAKINWRLKSDSDDPFHGAMPAALRSNKGFCFNGIKRNGPFDIDGRLARSWLIEPQNPNGKMNADVLAPYLNGDDLVGRSRDRWLIDFAAGRSLADITLFQHPFEYANREIKPVRAEGRTATLRNRWWEFEGLRVKLRKRLPKISWYCAISEKSHQYVWAKIDSRVLPDNRLVVVALDSFAILGILQSRFHERWMENTGSLLEDRRCYTPTTTFETFPFPEGIAPNVAKDYADDARAVAIAKAALRLDDLRNKWLNPSDLVRVEPEVVPGYPDRVLPKDAAAAKTLRGRTLTNLYNQQPQWLQDAHRDLDAAVAAAYGWSADISNEDALAELLKLNLSRAAAVKSADESDDDLLDEVED